MPCRCLTEYFHVTYLFDCLGCVASVEIGKWCARVEGICDELHCIVPQHCWSCKLDDPFGTLAGMQLHGFDSKRYNQMKLYV